MADEQESVLSALVRLDAHPGREPRRTQPSPPRPHCVHPWAPALETSLQTQSHQCCPPAHCQGGRQRKWCCRHQGRGRRVPTHSFSLLPLGPVAIVPRCWQAPGPAYRELSREQQLGPHHLGPFCSVPHPDSSASCIFLSCCCFVKEKEKTRSQASESDI